MDCLHLLAVQGTFKSLFQHHSSKASILQHSAFFTVQLSHLNMTTFWLTSLCIMGSSFIRTDFGTLWEKARVGCSERIALKQVYYQGWNRSPAQVGCMRQVLRAGVLGKTQRDRMRKEAGGGFRMGNTCKSMADSCQCMAKNTTIL